ncbi:SRPBCC family protein [Sutcliffiella cohnii]|nr:SRPBCC family protein [Sutcliffiella cohnii]
MMADLHDTVMIEKPLEEVFSYAANLQNSIHIMSNVTHIEKVTEGPVQPGTKFKETREIRGRKASAIIEIVEYEPPNTYSVKSESNGLKVVYRYFFENTAEGTKVTYTGDIYTTGIMMKLSKPIIKKILQKEDGDHLKQLKKVIEAKETIL